jgi:hypothetical protein
VAPALLVLLLEFLVTIPRLLALCALGQLAVRMVKRFLASRIGAPLPHFAGPNELRAVKGCLKVKRLLKICRVVEGPPLNSHLLVEGQPGGKTWHIIFFESRHAPHCLQKWLQHKWMVKSQSRMALSLFEEEAQIKLDRALYSIVRCYAFYDVAKATRVICLRRTLCGGRGRLLCG